MLTCLDVKNVFLNLPCPWEEKLPSPAPHLTVPFSRPPAITLMDTPSGWLENATEQMTSLQCTCPTRSPFTVQSLRSLPPPAGTKTTQVTEMEPPSRPWARAGAGADADRPLLAADEQMKGLPASHMGLCMFTQKQWPAPKSTCSREQQANEC